MNSKMTLVGLACATVLVPSAPMSADFSRVEVEPYDVSGCPRTFRFYAIFTDPNDQLLAVHGTYDQHFQFGTLHPIFNDGGAFAGLTQEDTAAAPISGPLDSWVTIGADEGVGNDTLFSPGFLGGDGVHAVIVGDWLVDTSGGWFDSNPGTPVTGTKILIAQLSILDGYPYFYMSGVIAWMPQGGDLVGSKFNAGGRFVWPCLGDLDGDGQIGTTDLMLLLEYWGPCQSTCCPGDYYRDDNEVGFDDLLRLLMWWGPCN